MKTVGLVLAGGQSRRMGRDKANLFLDGEPLLERAFHLLIGIFGSEHVFVSGQREIYPCIPDLNPGLGPLEGIRSAVVSFLGKWKKFRLLVIPVDMPCLDKRCLQRLLTEKPDASVRYRSFTLPCLLRCDQKVLHDLNQMKGWGSQYSFHALGQKVSFTELEPLNPGQFINLNTEQDLRQVMSHEYQN